MEKQKSKAPGSYTSKLVTANLVVFILVTLMLIPGLIPGNLYVATLVLLGSVIVAILNLTTIPVLLWRNRPKLHIVLVGALAILLAVVYLWLFYRLLYVPI